MQLRSPGCTTALHLRRTARPQQMLDAQCLVWTCGLITLRRKKEADNAMQGGAPEPGVVLE